MAGGGPLGAAGSSEGAGVGVGWGVGAGVLGAVAPADGAAVLIGWEVEGWPHPAVPTTTASTNPRRQPTV